LGEVPPRPPRMGHDRQDEQVAVVIEPPNSVILVVGREEFTPPKSFAGHTCVATADCVAIAVINVHDAPTSVTLSPAARAEDLLRLGEFEIETEGSLSVRDVYNRTHESVGVSPGVVNVTIWGNDDAEPSDVAVQFTQVP